MMISHEHRFVYIEVPRTGSSAVRRELEEMYGAKPILRKHATYHDFLRQATDDEKTYFAFSGIRNPLDVAVTRYVHLKDNVKDHFTDPWSVKVRNSLASRIERRIYAWTQRTNATFEQFLRRWYLLPYDTWTSLDHEGIDMVLRFENLQDDFAVALRRIGLEPVRPLPAVNVTPGRERDYVGYYTPESIKRATWVFGPYMEEWGYALPQSWGTVTVPGWSKVLMRIARFYRSIYWKHIRFGDYVARRPPRPAGDSGA
jgi:hypothetical protein